MRHRSRLANYPARAAAGAFILNAGITKLQAEKETASKVHGAAVGAYPMLEKVPPERFTKALGLAEVGLGGALLLPVVGDGLAGLGLAAFSGGLVGLYLRSPGTRQEGSIRPSQQGTALAKDVWLFGIGLSLLGHSFGSRRLARLEEQLKGAGQKARPKSKT